MSTHIYYNRIDGLYQVYCAIFFMKRKLTGACIKDFLRVRKAFFRVKNEKCLYHVRVEVYFDGKVCILNMCSVYAFGRKNVKKCENRARDFGW